MGIAPFLGSPTARQKCRRRHIARSGQAARYDSRNPLGLHVLPATSQCGASDFSLVKSLSTAAAAPLSGALDTL